MNLIRVIRKYDIKKKSRYQKLSVLFKRSQSLSFSSDFVQQRLTCFFLFNMYPDFRTIFLLAALMISESSGKQNHFLSDVLGYL